MSSTLTVNKQLTDTGWTITASIAPGGTLPLEIFVYENTGTNVLGNYYGVLTALDMPRIQIFTGSPISNLGNKFVRYGQATIYLTNGEDPDAVITVLKNSVQALSTSFQTIATSTQVFTIT